MVYSQWSIVHDFRGQWSINYIVHYEMSPLLACELLGFRTKFLY